MNRSRVPASLFSIVPGLSGLGQSWRVAVRLWHAPALAGEAVLAAATLVWGALVLAYGAHALRDPARVADEFAHPVGGATPALIGISTFLVAQAVLPYSRALAWLLTIAGIAWHLAFAVWHTGRLWQGGRDIADTAPTIYLPTVAGNFTGAAALGALGAADWAWLLLGAGVFSWLALEPLVIRRLWHREPMPVAERSLVGIQFAPPFVCAAAMLAVAPDSTDRWLVMLLGYGLFQLLVGLRLKSWLGAQPFAYSWWAYSFGVASGTLACAKLALAGVSVAHALALPMFVGANLFIGYLCVRSLACLALARTTASS